MKYIEMLEEIQKKHQNNYQYSTACAIDDIIKFLLIKEYDEQEKLRNKQKEQNEKN